MSVQPDHGQEDLDSLLSDLKSIGMPIREKMEFGVVKFSVYKKIISGIAFEFEAVDNIESILDAVNTKEFIDAVCPVIHGGIDFSKNRKWDRLDQLFDAVVTGQNAYYILVYLKSESRVIHSREVGMGYINLGGIENLGLIDLI